MILCNSFDITLIPDAITIPHSLSYSLHTVLEHPPHPITPRIPPEHDQRRRYRHLPYLHSYRRRAHQHRERDEHKYRAKDGAGFIVESQGGI